MCVCQRNSLHNIILLFMKVCVYTRIHTPRCVHVKSDTVVLYFGEFSVSIDVYNDHLLLPNIQQDQD